jgi:hypothetical protein
MGVVQFNLALNHSPFSLRMDAGSNAFGQAFEKPAPMSRCRNHTGGEIIWLVEIGDQSRLLGLPAQQFARPCA